MVRLLAKLFGVKDSELATQNRPLWQCFLGRYEDTAPALSLLGLRCTGEREFTEYDCEPGEFNDCIFYMEITSV